jgi:selenide,water dikinase
MTDLVLVGGGHAHVEVLRRFARRPVPAVRLTLVSPDPQMTYSAMLPGVIAGHYPPEAAQIALAPLCRSAGARFVRDSAVGLDPVARRLFCGTAPLGYDLLSLDIGATARLDVPGAAAHALPVKPVGSLLARWLAVEARIRLAPQRRLRIAVVGAGAGGVELLLAMQHRIGSLGAAAAELELFGSAADILPSHNPRVRARLGRVLAERDISVHRGCAVSRVATGVVETRDGTRRDFDLVVWATASGATPFLAAAGLATDADGFVAVDAGLRSLSHPTIFAAGDVAALAGHALPKAGVFAVREGRILAANLQRAVTGRELRRYVPQRRTLFLITTGDRSAVASHGAWAAEGRLVWRLKDWIDRRFVERYRE